MKHSVLFQKCAWQVSMASCVRVRTIGRPRIGVERHFRAVRPLGELVQGCRNVHTVQLLGADVHHYLCFSPLLPPSLLK